MKERPKRKRINEKNTPIKYNTGNGHSPCKKCSYTVFIKEYKMEVCNNCGQRYREI